MKEYVYKCNECKMEVIEGLYCENSECKNYGKYDVKLIERSK